MYKAYKREVEGSQSDDIVVDRCWKVIESQCQNTRSKSKEAILSEHVGWKSARVFVSSTFTDFHCEREMLVKKVFPNLREWCEYHKLTLIECDLRWGVPKDSTTSTTIATCMEEIDRCYEENGEVFFLNMLGEKYGWIPEPSDLNEETTEKYSWIPGISITHMEILHGAYRNTNPHALFMLRSQDLIKDLPEDRLSRFQDSSKLSQNHLQVLKKKIREKFPGQVFDYDCVYAGMETTSTGRERVLLTGLERFEEICLDFFKRAFEKKFAKYFESEALTPSEQENALHKQLQYTKGSEVIGRQKEIDALFQFVSGLPFDKNIISAQDQANGDTGSGALCVCAPSGSGKSALLAAFANHAEQSFRVLYHDIGGSPESTMRDNILTRMLSFLDPNEQDPGDDIPDKLKAKLEAIAEDKTTDKVSVIILDGINQLSAGSSCDFLPTKFPTSVKCVLSVETSSHKASYQEVLNYTSYALHLKELCQDYQELLVNSYFSQFSKKLDRDQLRVILSNPAASSPLWLTLACHELRIFGDFRTLTSKIENLSPSLLGLLKEILNRLVTEDESMQMTQVLKFIYCSIGGLPESEIPLMLNPKNPVAPLVLANIRRQLKPFLRSVVFLRNGASRIQFFHDAMYKNCMFRRVKEAIGENIETLWIHLEAVKENVLKNDDDENNTHSALADFYQQHCKDDAYITQDLPEHLHRAAMKQRLVDFYRKDKRSIPCPVFTRQLHLNSVRCEQFTAHLASSQSYPICVCVFCEHKQRAFSPLPLLARATCPICASFVPDFCRKEERLRAKMCHRHWMQQNLLQKCFICKRIIHNNEKKLDLYLCHICGNRGSKCAMLSV